jgi:hypothetical protein
VLTILQDTSSTDRISYQIELPAGATIVRDEAGEGAWILDSYGEPYTYLESAWALDATGRSVPTWFLIEGNSLVQIIDHTSSNFTYPIVADPSWIWWVGTSLACAAELGTLAFGAAKVISAFAKAEKIIKASKNMINAYKELGNKMQNVIDALKKYIKNRSSLTKKQINALETLSKAAIGSVITILGVGSCYSLWTKGT